MSTSDEKKEEEKRKSLRARIFSGESAASIVVGLMGTILAALVIWLAGLVFDLSYEVKRLKERDEQLEEARVHDQFPVVRKWVSCQQKEDEYGGRYKFIVDTLECIRLPDDPRALPVDPDLPPNRD